MTRMIVATACLVLLCGVAPQSRQAPAPRLRAGAAKTDITPKVSDLTLPTDSIRDALFARAVVIDDGRNCAVIVGLDLGGASSQMVGEAVSRDSDEA
jgi:hypothetical protein